MIMTFLDGGFRQLLPYMKNSFPKLESVQIANIAESRNDCPLLYSWVFSFLGRHSKTITELTLILPEGKINGRGTSGNHNLLPDLLEMNIRDDFRSDLQMPHRTYLHVKLQLENFKQLKTFVWDVGMLEGFNRYDLGATILSSQTMLVELHIDNIHLKDLQIWGILSSLFQSVSGTLETFFLGGCFCKPPFPLGAPDFNCSWLSNCKRLQRLEMVVCETRVVSIEDLPFEGLRLLNIGHMLVQDQIEEICRRAINLETWVVPQRGSLKFALVAKVTTYLFESMLHLPKLKTLSLFSAAAELDDILNYVREQTGIRRRGRMLPLEQQTYEDVQFCIDRALFVRDHSQLNRFMERNRRIPVQQMNEEDVIAQFMRDVREAIGNPDGGVLFW